MKVSTAIRVYIQGDQKVSVHNYQVHRDFLITLYNCVYVCVCVYVYVLLCVTLRNSKTHRYLIGGDALVRYMNSNLCSIYLMCSYYFNIIITNYFLLWRCDPTWVMASSFLRFLDHTQRRTTVGRTPLDEWSACRGDLYLTTHNTRNRQRNQISSFGEADESI